MDKILLDSLRHIWSYLDPATLGICRFVCCRWYRELNGKTSDVYKILFLVLPKKVYHVMTSCVYGLPDGCESPSFIPFIQMGEKECDMCTSGRMRLFPEFFKYIAKNNEYMILWELLKNPKKVFFIEESYREVYESFPQFVRQRLDEFAVRLTHLGYQNKSNPQKKSVPGWFMLP
jgi:hypothetical protein